ncbi:hypothetical protein FN846DRAFT_941770 [Sphaerosporella brunnea]|uniref:Uncharacterized protein n=1 Tax=Sphaerosporella brunnea TaxID=1250544 RepID=A0A5J5F1P0_9PEZI|nr:hypothetical protein FN846DRAFT_941770 [Sphaerosporella brunnea]
MRFFMRFFPSCYFVACFVVSILSVPLELERRFVAIIHSFLVLWQLLDATLAVALRSDM